MDFGTIAARALNCAWATHRPTYAGLRLLLLSIGGGDALCHDYLLRRARSRSTWRYYGFPITKDASLRGEAAYRSCIVGSPLTLLAESYVLGEMASEPAFAAPARSYSYRWPSSESCGRNFEYYFTGYLDRHADVSRLLAQTPGSIAVIMDIEKFYPSVDIPRLNQRIAGRVRRVRGSDKAGAVQAFLEGYLATARTKAATGIPIGPDTSHALGHIALESFDTAMTERHGVAYFRYVDDIIVVCDPGSADGVLGHARNLLAEEGLKLNEAKTDTVAATDWLAAGGISNDKDDPTSFDSLTADIIRYLIKHPDKIDAIQAAFRSAGLSLPVGRLGALSKSSRYHSFLGLHDLWDWSLKLFRDRSTEPHELIAHALAVRERYRREFDDLASVPLPSAPMPRRWAIQRWRRVLSRLVYLQPPSAYLQALQGVPRVGELADIFAVMTSVATGNADGILRYPGRPTSTYIHLWQASRDDVPTFAEPGTPSRATAASLADLCVSLAVPAPDGVAEALAERFPGTSLMLDLCSSKSPAVSPTPQSYLDEIQLLFGGKSPDALSALFATRHDEREEIDLDAIGLLGEHSLLFAPHPGYG